jgi:hypothetical protein
MEGEVRRLRREVDENKKRGELERSLMERRIEDLERERE